jgi:hypothetical protein
MARKMKEFISSPTVSFLKSSSRASFSSFCRFEAMIANCVSVRENFLPQRPIRKEKPMEDLSAKKFNQFVSRSHRSLGSRPHTADCPN